MCENETISCCESAKVAQYKTWTGPKIRLKILEKNFSQNVIQKSIIFFEEKQPSEYRALYRQKLHVPSLFLDLAICLPKFYVLFPLWNIFALWS